MNKIPKKIYLFLWAVLLAFIGRTADDLLFMLMEKYKLHEVPHINIYISITAVAMMVTGFLLVVLSLRNRELRQSIMVLNVLIGGIIGGTGSVWLTVILFRYWLQSIIPVNLK